MIDLRDFPGWSFEMPDSFHADRATRVDGTPIVTLGFEMDSLVSVILPLDGARALRDELSRVLEGAK